MRKLLTIMILCIIIPLASAQFENIHLKFENNLENTGTTNTNISVNGMFLPYYTGKIGSSPILGGAFTPGTVSNSSVNITDHNDLDFTGQFSVAYWFNITTSGATIYLMDKGGINVTGGLNPTWTTTLLGDTSIAWFKDINPSVGFDNPIVRMNSTSGQLLHNWNHIVIKRDSAFNITVCINTVCNVTSPVDSTNYTNFANISIGYRSDAIRSGGSIDDLRIWKNYALSQADINFLYNAGAGTQVPLVIGENYVNYTLVTLEGTAENYLGNFSYNNVLFPSVTANMVYNGTIYPASVSTNGNELILTRTLTTPQVTVNTNFTFFWNINLLNSTGSPINFNSSIKTQQVNNVGVDNCTSNTVKFMNLTVRDEETQLILNRTTFNVTIEVDLTINGNFTFNGSFSQQNPVTLCLSGNLTSTNSSLDALIRYEAFDHVSEFYNFQAYPFNNNNIPIQVELYDLATVDSQEFLISVFGSNFLPMTDALVDITRKYIGEGVFKSVEIPKTDSLGKTVGHFVLADVIYTLIVKKNNEVLGIFENIQVVCQDQTIGNCQLTLNLESDANNLGNYTQFENIIFTMGYVTSTRTVTASFSSTDLSSNLMNLTATLVNGTFLCTNSITASSGALSCVVPITFVGQTGVGKLYKGSTQIGEIIFFIGDSTGNELGSAGFIMLGILMITLPLMFIGDRIIMVLAMVIGGIMGAFLGIYTGGSIIGGTSIIMWLIISAVILIWKLSRIR